MVTLKTFRSVVLVTAVLALAVVVMGAYVRLSHAGLSCPDWPGCYGRMPGQQVGTPVILVGLVIFQALLGMWTVTLLLKPAVVVAHLLGGLITLALCRWLYLRHGGREAAAVVPDAPKTAIWLAVAVIIFQIGLGGWTSANYAALACPDFPLCQGRLWPQMSLAEGFRLWHGPGRNFEGGVLAGDARVAIHFVHRIGALVTFLYVGGLAIYLMRRRLSRGLSRAAGVMLVVLIAQIVLGISIVEFHLPLPVAVAHNGMAALLLLSVISVYHMAVPPKSAL